MHEKIERLGVSSGWEKYWIRASKGLAEATAAHDPKRAQDLEGYVADGLIPIPPEFAIPEQPVNPPRLSWQTSDLASRLSGYAMSRQFEFENSWISGEKNIDLASCGFAAAYLSQMIQLDNERLFPLRFGGRRLKALSLRSIPYVALGVVLGCEPQARILARAQLAAYRSGYFRDTAYYPIFVFILRLLANYLEEADIDIHGEALQEPVFLNLFEAWKFADAEDIAPLCLAALDIHTHRSKQGNAKNFYEFEQGDWIKIPIEIWLLFKLRELISLKNPSLDHPLMRGAGNISSTDSNFKADPLILAVYARMKRDGFDEGEICKGFSS
jgi:hypothetical protein